MFVIVKFLSTNYRFPIWNYNHEEGQYFSVENTYDPLVFRAFELFNTRVARGNTQESTLFVKRLLTKDTKFVESLKYLSVELEHPSLEQLCDFVLLQINLQKLRF